MELPGPLRKIGQWIEEERREDRMRNIPIEKVYEQLLRYHQELLRLFAPQSTLPPPRLVIFEPGPSTRNPRGMPKKLDGQETEELATFINTCLPPEAGAFYASNYDGVFVCRGGLKSQKKLDQTLAEEEGHRIVQIPEDQISLTIEMMETLNGPMPDFGKKMSANLKTNPPLPRTGKDHWSDPYGLSMNEFFPPLFVFYLTGQEYPVNPEDFIQGRLTESMVDHLPLLAGKMLVTQYQGDVKAIVRDHPQLAQMDGQQIWSEYCLPILTTGTLLL